MSDLKRAIRQIASPAGTATGGRPPMFRGMASVAGAGLLACTLLPGTGHGLTVGELYPQSALGQPLRAVIPVRTATGETLDARCIQAVPALSGATSLRDVQVRVESSGGAQQLIVTTRRPLHEPLYEVALQLNCPGTPLLVRQYVLMLDLPATFEQQPSTATTIPRLPDVDEALPPSRPATERPRTRISEADSVPAASLVGGTRYRVQPGDTLTGIAARLNSSGAAPAVTVEQIFAANVEVFPGGNPDRLPAGAELLLPGSPAATQATAPVTAAAPAAPMPASAISATDAPPVPAAASAAAAIQAAIPLPADQPAAEVVDAASLEAPTAKPAPARRPAARAKPAASPAAASTGSWLPLAAGLGAGLLGSLLLLSRSLRERLASFLPRRSRKPAEQPVARPMAESLPAATPTPAPVRNVPEPAISVSYDYEGLDEPISQRFPAARPAEAPHKAAVPDPEPSATFRAAPASLADDITADLEQLFLDEPATKTMAAPDATGRFRRTAPTEMVDIDPTQLGVELDGELTRMAADVPIDVGIGDTRDDLEVQPTIAAPGGAWDVGEDLDGDLASPQDAGTRTQALLDAMDLLERDYEEELTASQLLDPEAVQAAMERGRELEATGRRRR